MDSEIAKRESRREAVLASLALTPPATIERRLRELVGGDGGSFNEWDQRFLEFVASHGDEPLLTGTTGAGFFFAFSTRDAEGFWLLASPDGARGKGFLTSHDAGRILDLARLKGLC